MASRCTGVSAALVACGLAATAADAFVNPAATGRAAELSSTTYSSPSALSAAETASVQPEAQASSTGLWLGLAAGLLVGFSGAMTQPANAQNTFVRPGQQNEKRINMKDLRAEADQLQKETNAEFDQLAFDRNVSLTSVKAVEKLDVDREFNGEAVSEQFKVDMAKAPKFDYPKVKNNMNDPAIRIGDSDKA
eukprot:TRINITY_DN514_c0_g1_i2.p2 TRINITY_DN514_c0_g1~~TRINITY_DN514_c0_g1_i2.p2  ORF type:complete len:192 (-),score=65.07 TRINITY_DN514_c0_g1_i2:277-852(-)